MLLPAMPESLVCVHERLPCVVGENMLFDPTRFTVPWAILLARDVAAFFFWSQKHAPFRDHENSFTGHVLPM